MEDKIFFLCLFKFIIYYKYYMFVYIIYIFNIFVFITAQLFILIFDMILI
jgi:hypothetical protein